VSNPNQVQTFIDPEKAAADVSIHETGGIVDPSEFLRQPGLVYYYVAAAAKAERQLSTLKLREDLAEAEAKAKAANDILDEGGKATVDAVKVRAASDRNFIAAQAAVIKAKEVLDSIKAVCEALRHKKDMLVMRGHMSRDEIKAKLSVEEDLQGGAGASIADKQARLRKGLASVREGQVPSDANE
jgi:hypothetical protein